jgi:hypothetical protein
MTLTSSCTSSCPHHVPVEKNEIEDLLVKTATANVGNSVVVAPSSPMVPMMPWAPWGPMDPMATGGDTFKPFSAKTLVFKKKSIEKHHQKPMPHRYSNIPMNH